MPIDSIHLSKALRLASMSTKDRTISLRNDAREFVKAERFGPSGNPMDFYAPMWKDIKLHCLNGGGLIGLTAARIEENGRRRNIYSKLRDGFLSQWPSIRGVYNGPITQSDNKITATISVSGMEIKISNLFGLKSPETETIYYYPYLFVDPALNENMAQAGLSILYDAIGKRTKGRISILEPAPSQLWKYDGGADYSFHREVFGREVESILSEWKYWINIYQKK